MQSIEKYLTKEGWQTDLDETKRDIKKGLESLVNTPLVKLYRNNKYINLNANILAAAYPSIAVAAKTSQLMSDGGFSDVAITTGAITADWLAYIPVHLALHRMSKGHQFKDESGKMDKEAFWKDVRKVYWTQLPSVALFYAMAGPLHLGLMKSGMEADNANLFSYWGTLITTRALHNYNYWKAEKRGKHERYIKTS